MSGELEEGVLGFVELHATMYLAVVGLPPAMKTLTIPDGEKWNMILMDEVRVQWKQMESYHFLQPVQPEDLS